jgi:hypothetical protein
MRAKILIVSLITILLAACNKDKFTTKPQIEFDNVNTDVVQPGSQLIITLTYRDKEGDIRDSIYVERRAVNCETDTIRALYAIPTNVPKIKNAEGNIVISYSHLPDFTYPNIGDPTCGTAADTCIYRFALSDEAGNVSDTISSPQIIIVKR